jgi:hypothetical protein
MGGALVSGRVRWATCAIYDERIKRIGIEPGKSFEIEGVDSVIREMNADTMGVYGNYYLKRAIVAHYGLGAIFPRTRYTLPILVTTRVSHSTGQSSTGCTSTGEPRHRWVPSGRSRSMTRTGSRSRTVRSSASTPSSSAAPRSHTAGSPAARGARTRAAESIAAAS